MRLVADVGGTRTRVALAQGRVLRSLRIVPTSQDVGALLREYLDEHGIEQADLACCGAGPVRADGSLRLTNVDCVLEPAALAQAVRSPHVRVVNDFAAVAYALPALDAHELRACGGGIADVHAPRVVLGAGTGLGVASLVRCGASWQALPGEGGHVDLAPVTEEEYLVCRRLALQHARISAECVLSGPGLERLHAALHEHANDGSAALISQAAQAGDVHACHTLRVFSRWLGRVAGDLVLSLGARGGVYLAGGIVPGWGDAFDVAAFRSGFEDKAPMRDWLAQVPSFVVTHAQPGLLGLAVMDLH